MIKAALYLRVSSEMQIDNFSIAAQLAQLREYCVKNEIEPIQVYQDEGLSGQKENRPAFQQMIKDAEKKIFDIILVHKFDRFARKVELSHRIKAQLKKAGVNVISMSEPVEDSPIGFFQEGILELLSEYYVKNLAREVKKGHKERASQGYHNGSIPFGYKKSLTHPSKMEINEEQAEVVKLIFEKYNKEGWGTTKIAAWLNEMNIASAVGGDWAHFTVNRIVKNVKYIGMILYDGEIYKGLHDAIIEVSQFDLAAANKKNRTWSTAVRGANFSKFLFLGLLQCGECGKVMRLQSNVKSHGKRLINSLYYYVCNNASHYDTRHTKKCTHLKSYSVARTEKELLLRIESDIKEGINSIELAPKLDIKNVLETTKESILKELNKAKNAYNADVYSLEEYGIEKKRLEADLREIENSQSDLPTKEKELFHIRANTLWEKFKQTTDIMEGKNILKQFIEIIIISRGSVRIRYKGQ